MTYIAVTLVVLVLVAAVALVAIKHHNGSSADATTTSATTPITTITSYQGAGFSMQYPTSWGVSHLNEGNRYLDSTFQPPGGGGMLIRVDENPNYTGGSLSVAAMPVIAALQREPSYSLVSAGYNSLEGLQSFRWEFEVTENGVRLHKIDTSFVDAGSGWAILIQSPQGVWVQESAVLESYQGTFSAVAAAPAAT